MAIEIVLEVPEGADPRQHVTGRPSLVTGQPPSGVPSPRASAARRIALPKMTSARPTPRWDTSTCPSGRGVPSREGLADHGIRVGIAHEVAPVRVARYCPRSSVRNSDARSAIDGRHARRRSRSRRSSRPERTRSGRRCRRSGPKEASVMTRSAPSTVSFGSATTRTSPNGVAENAPPRISAARASARSRSRSHSRDWLRARRGRAPGGGCAPARPPRSSRRAPGRRRGAAQRAIATPLTAAVRCAVIGPAIEERPRIPVVGVVEEDRRRDRRQGPRSDRSVPRWTGNRRPTSSPAGRRPRPAMSRAATPASRGRTRPGGGDGRRAWAAARHREMSASRVRSASASRSSTGGSGLEDVRRREITRTAASEARPSRECRSQPGYDRPDGTVTASSTRRLANGASPT